MGKPTTNTTKKTITRKAAPKNGAAPAPADTTSAIPTPLAEAKPRRATKVTKPVAATIAVKTKPAKKAQAPKRTTTAQKRTVKSQSPVVQASYSQDDVALRAYFISEKRQQTGMHGSPESDWLEAERQLQAECGS